MMAQIWSHKLKIKKNGIYFNQTQYYANFWGIPISFSSYKTILKQQLNDENWWDVGWCSSAFGWPVFVVCFFCFVLFFMLVYQFGRMLFLFSIFVFVFLMMQNWTGSLRWAWPSSVRFGTKVLRLEHTWYCSKAYYTSVCNKAIVGQCAIRLLQYGLNCHFGTTLPLKRKHPVNRMCGFEEDC